MSTLTNRFSLLTPVVFNPLFVYCSLSQLVIIITYYLLRKLTSYNSYLINVIGKCSGIRNVVPVSESRCGQLGSHFCGA